MQPKRFSVQLAANKVPEVFIYDDIGAGPWGGISAKDFAREWKKLDSAREINIRINSGGGDVFDGLAIYNTIKRHQGYKTVDVDGAALSIASVIALAGNRVRLADGAMLMIHDPWTITMGTQADHEHKAGTLGQVKMQLLDIYHQRTGLAREELAEMMTQETWIDGKKAVELGFADEETPQLAIAAKVLPECLRSEGRELLAVKKTRAMAAIEQARKSVARWQRF